MFVFPAQGDHYKLWVTVLCLTTMTGMANWQMHVAGEDRGETATHTGFISVHFFSQGP